MEVSLLGSIFYVVAFVLLFLGVFQYKKSDNELNGVSWLLISFVAILCYGALGAGLINIVNIPVNIFSIGAIYFVTALLLLILIKKENVKQQYKWERYDFIWFGILTIIVFLLAGSYFGTELRLMYFNSDAAVHFKNAMAVVRREALDSMYFAPLQTALIIEVFMPFVAEVNLYKVFILIDSAMLLLEIAFFMVVIRDFVKTKAMKVIALIVVIVYMLGYPLNSFLFSFYYWGMGVMLIGFMLLMLRYYGNKEVDRKVSVLGMMLCCVALPNTYMIFGPIMYIAAFITLAIYRHREGKLMTIENVLLALKLFLLPTCIAVYYCLFGFMIPANVTVGGVLNINGGVYRDLYINFLWVLPFVVYMVIKMLREKKINETMVSLLCFGGVLIAMLVLICLDVIGAYYFHKLYYPLWLFAFVLTAEALEKLWTDSKDLLISMFAVFACVALLFWTNIESRLVYSGKGLSSSDKSTVVFDIWSYNRMLYNSRYLKYSEEYFEACNYVIEELKEEEKAVPLLATQENYSACFWYEGITGESCSDFYGWFYPFDVVKEKIENKEINYFVVYKDSPIYAAYEDYFEEFEYVFENELALVAKVNE